MEELLISAAGELSLVEPDSGELQGEAAASTLTSPPWMGEAEREASGQLMAQTLGALGGNGVLSAFPAASFATAPAASTPKTGM